MKTDALSYRLLQELPEAFFELIGRPAATARRYRFAAHELKDTAVRLDGLYEPIAADFKEPVYLVEYQNQKSPRVYSNLILKIGFFLEKVEPRQDWHAVVIYPNRSMEQDDLYPYRGFLRLEQVTRIYLEELPDPPPEAFGLRVLKMLATPPGKALVQAQELIPEVRLLARTCGEPGQAATIDRDDRASSIPAFDPEGGRENAASGKYPRNQGLSGSSGGRP